jgi:hypothetical protein
MWETNKKTALTNALSIGVSFVLAVSIIVPGLSAATDVGVDSIPAQNAQEGISDPSTPIVDLGGDAAPLEDCAASIHDFLKGPDGTPFNPFVESQYHAFAHSASIAVKNFSQTCSYTIHNASYRVFVPVDSPDFVATQKLFNTDTAVIAPGQTVTLAVPRPTCAYQADFFEGPVVPQTNPDFANPPLINSDGRRRRYS